MRSASQQIRSISQETLMQLAREYDKLKRTDSPDAPRKLLEIGNIIESSQGAFDISGEFDPDLFRIFLKSRALSDISSDIVLSKISGEELEIESLGDKVGQSMIDQIVMTRFASLGDKIIHFNYIARNHESELTRSIRHLLVLSYIADKPFYLHLESLILKLDDVRYFPEQYSYNPYEGKQVLLNEAVSHLLNIIIKKESKTESGIASMKDLIDKYKLVIQYRYIFEPNEKGLCHPIFYLIESKMWDELYKWIEEDPKILMVADSTGKNPLITTILTFAHGSIVKKEHDQLLKLQKFAIEKYIEKNLAGLLPDTHSIIEPQIGLFIGYLEYEKTSGPSNAFMRTTKLYYKKLIEYFIERDYNSFFRARINSSFVDDLQDTYMISCLSLIFRSEVILDEGIIIPSKIDFLSKEDLIADLYSGVIVRDKVNERAEEILCEIGKLLESYSDAKPVDQFKIGQDNIVKRMFDDYLKLKYSSSFADARVIDKLYETIIIAVGNPSFNPTNFILSQVETFNMISAMGSIELLSALEERIDSKYNEDLLKILVPNGITAIWLGRKDNSDRESYKVLLGIAKVLNSMIIKSAYGEDVVLLDVAEQVVRDELTAYLTCEVGKANIETIDGLDLQFIDGKFQLKGNGAYGSVRLYNFYSAFLLRKLYFAENITFDQLFPKVKVPRDRSLFGNINSLLFGPPQEKYKFKCEQNAIHGINLYLLYLGNRKNHFHTLDENLSELFNLFTTLDRRNPIFKSVNDATSTLWQNIRMIGSSRSRLVLDFFIKQGYLINDRHNIICIVTRCAKASLISGDLEGFKMWIDYSLEMSRDEGPLPSERGMNHFVNTPYISNVSQAVAIHDAINIAVGLNMPQGLQVILSKYRNFLTIYRSRKIFSEHTTFPFAIIREHSKSKLMEIESFRESLNKMAVLLLEGGYPIELIEECSDLNAISFIKSLVKEQVKYSLQRAALNYLDILPIPFITQFKSISNGVLDIKYYLGIYEKSFNFIYSKTQENTVNIGEFCHVFSSVLQPKDFLSRLKKIGFLTGLRDDFTELELLCNARKVANLVKGTELVGAFTLRWNCTISNSTVDFMEICRRIDAKLETESLEGRDDQSLEIEEVNFFHNLYISSQKKDQEIAIHKMEQEDSMRVLAHIGATVITGTFILLNNPEMRNTVITLIPTVYSGLTLAGSVTSSIVSTVASSILDISYSGLYLLIAGATVYAGCKIYNGIKSEKVVQLDLEMFEDLVKEWQCDYSDRHFKPITSKENVYLVVAKIFKGYTKSDLIESDKFFSIIDRFGISYAELDHSIYCLKHGGDDIAENILTIASVMSYVAMYLNSQKIKKIVDAIEDCSKQKFQTLLHDIMAGKIVNIPVAMSDIGMRGRFECLKALHNIGLPIAMDSYNYKKNYYYLYLWHSEDIKTRVLEMPGARRDSADQFSRFILVLEQGSNQRSQSKEATIEL